MQQQQQLQQQQQQNNLSYDQMILALAKNFMIDGNNVQNGNFNHSRFINLARNNHAHMHHPNMIRIVNNNNNARNVLYQNGQSIANAQQQQQQQQNILIVPVVNNSNNVYNGQSQQQQMRYIGYHAGNTSNFTHLRYNPFR